jgi:3-hydroxyisobutyrate dehydrogenase-like beta-hydroxyacid dehydrogenase
VVEPAFAFLGPGFDPFLAEAKRMAKVAFIGLGVMGSPMAGHLARAGHEVTAYNRTRAKADAWVAKHGGRAAATPAEAAAGAAVVFSCVGDDPDLRAIALGPDGSFAAMAKGAVHVDHTTASAGIARELAAEAARRGFAFLDAPVSGGESGAQNGTLTVMVGGDADAFERARPVIAHFARAVTLMGPSGAGQLTKMVNQICIVGVVQGLAEAIDFGLRAGLDMKRVLEVISKGAANSWQMENRGPTMIDDKFDFGFATDWMRKDLRICLAEGAQNGATLAMTRMIEGFYGEIQAMGGGRWDSSALIRRLRRAPDR